MLELFSFHDGDESADGRSRAEKRKGMSTSGPYSQAPTGTGKVQPEQEVFHLTHNPRNAEWAGIS